MSTVATSPKKGWFRLISDSETAIIFVHGFLSNAQSCWTNNKKICWPEIIASDTAFDGTSIYLAEYHTSIASNFYDVSQCAKELYEQLKFQPENVRPPLDYKNIIFICHSLGGIITRRVIEENRSVFSKKILGLILIGSPSTGSEYARLFSSIANLYRNKVAKQLRPDGALLMDLDARFKDLLHNQGLPNLIGCEAVEHHGLLRFRLLPFRTPPIVSAESAARYFGSPRVIPDTDHFSIVKPIDSRAAIHIYLSQFYIQSFIPFVKKKKGKLPRNSSPSTTPSHETASHRALVLFDMYSEHCAPYYLCRKNDSELEQKIEYTSLWITGPSGSGKTSLAKRYIHTRDLKPIQIEFTNFSSAENIENYFRIILQTYATIKDDSTLDKSPATFTDVVNVIAEVASESPTLPLFIDELLVTNEGEKTKQLVDFIEKLLDATKRRIGSHVRFLICSINQPESSVFSSKGKEQINLFPLSCWTDDELTKLTNSLLVWLEHDPLSNDEINLIVQKANGSPRYVKSFFRAYMGSNTSNNAEKFSTALLRAGDVTFRS